MLKRVIFYGLMMMLLTARSFAGQLSARVEPQQIQFGETVKLEIIYEGQDSGLIQPQFEVLNDDFAIYSTSNSMQAQFVNGVSLQKRIWTLTLMPQKEGKVLIPAITAGNYKTTPLNIEVLPSGAASVGSSAQSAANKAKANSSADFWTEMSIDSQEAYVKQEINGTLVIYDGKNIQFTENPAFVNAEDWKIMPIGAPVVTTKNNQRIIKIKYAFFPQKSGKLKLPSAVIKGFYSENNPNQVTHSVNGFLRLFDIDFDVADFTRQQKPVMLKTKPIEMEIKPIPEDYGDNWWLPSTSVSIQARWSDERPVFKMGEAVTREITLTAASVEENQLPILEFPDNPAWKQYPENPVLSSAVQNNSVVSTAKTRVVYIPQRGGEQVIPEVALRWYNVKTHHIEKAVIPAEKMFIGGIINEPQPQANLPLAMNTPDNVKLNTPENKVSSAPLKSHNDKVLIWIIIVCAFLGGAICNYLFLRRKISRATENNSTDAVREIEKYLQNSDYRALRDSLIHWGETVFADAYINNLNDLSAQIKAPEFTEQMQILNQNLYAGGTSALDKDIILKYVKGWQKTKSKAKKSPLPDLYK